MATADNAPEISAVARAREVFGGTHCRAERLRPQPRYRRIAARRYARTTFDAELRSCLVERYRNVVVVLAIIADDNPPGTSADRLDFHLTG